MSIELRISRTFKWVRDPHQEIRYGGPPPHQILEHTDTLEMRVDGGEWAAVPVVEAEKPPHPFAGRQHFASGRFIPTPFSPTTER